MPFRDVDLALHLSKCVFRRRDGSLSEKEAPCKTQRREKEENVFILNSSHYISGNVDAHALRGALFLCTCTRKPLSPLHPDVAIQAKDGSKSDHSIF